MKRQELIEFSQHTLRHRGWILLAVVAFCLLWLVGLFSLESSILDDISLFVLAAAVPVVALITMAVVMWLRMPKCPHCGIRMYAQLLATAIASGNCGHCGQSIED